MATALMQQVRCHQCCQGHRAHRWMLYSLIAFLQNSCAVLVQVYALLHRQEVFAPFRSQPRFADLMENIFLVLDHFNAKVRCWPQELYSYVPLVDVECSVLAQ